VHFGHLRSAEEVRERAGLAQVWLIPANSPPHKDAHAVAPPADRRRPPALALGAAAPPRPCGIELERSGPSYTIDTLRLLHERHPDESFALIVGLDAFRELHTWHRWEEIPGCCDLVVTSRPPEAVEPGPAALERATNAIAVRGAFWYDSAISSFLHPSGHRLDFVPVTAIDVSASAVRSTVAAGRSIRFLTPDAVADYIVSHGLYGAPQPV
jgi:nicotinate-nucleotide adenylyltransferase